MKEFNLKRTIPLVGIGTFVLVGCGARTIDESGEGGSSDRLSDDNFDAALLSSFEDVCRRSERCGYSDYGDPEECAEYYSDNLDDGFDLGSRECRRLALDALDCVARQRSCDDSAYYACVDELFELGDVCGNYDDYYDEY